MSWSDWAAGAVAVGVGTGLSVLAVHDARTGRVPVAPMRWLTVGAIAGSGGVAVAASRWSALLGAAVGAVVVTAVQGVPWLIQQRRGGDWIGRADVRLAPPIGWMLGWFGPAFAVVGLTVALVTGLVVCGATRRTRIPFVPPLAVGFWVALGWAVLVR